MRRTNSVASYFQHFILFNLCFLGLQFALIYTQAGSFTSLITLPVNIYLEYIATLGVHIGLYLTLSLVQTWLLLGVLKRSWQPFSAERWQIIIWSLCVCTILCANAYYFPLSSFSKLLSPPITEFSLMILLIFSLAGLSLLMMNRLFYRSSLPILALVIAVILWHIDPHPTKVPDQTKDFDSRPNIIILGIDSLSPESVNKENMPFLYQLLQGSTQFTNTISPLARTYPAWSSILTGLYVKHHHAEENLVAKSSVNSKASIIWALNQQGYNTIYATDDRRFNSIDKDFGFKTIIGPQLGINDVLLGSYNDFPLSNLLINFRISSLLFPYNYSNRASFYSYYPETFSKKLQNTLSQQQNSPLFLAVHFTLPHWPYAWAESLPEQVNNEFSLEKRDGLYQRALQRVDTQLHSFYSYLKQHNYYRNSVLILLSDHGEALYYPNSRLTNYQNYQGTLPSRLAEYFKNKTATDLDKSAGHGSDILSPKQYHSILAFNVYKNGQLITIKAQINTRVALFDLAPTLLDFLKLTVPQNMDGRSLMQSILNPSLKPPQRNFFIESGMFPNQDISKRKAMAIGKQFYKVNPQTGELELKASGLTAIAKQKIYGIIKGNWVLALYPDDKSYIPVIQNLITGQWTDDLNSHFAKSTPVAQLIQSLSQFYGTYLFLPIKP